MEQKKLFRRFIYASAQSRNLFAEAISACATSCGITKPEADVLLFFANNPEFTNAVDAVNYRGFSKAYVSKALSLLQQRDFIAIETSPSDRRYQQITIKPKAQKSVKKLQKCQRDFFSSLKEGIPDDEFHTFLNVIDKMLDNYFEKLNQK